MYDNKTIWGVHMSTHHGSQPIDEGYISLGWPKMGDLNLLTDDRESYKSKLAEVYPEKKPGAIPVDAWHGPGTGRGVLDFDDQSLDYVFSSHCLEHIENWHETLDKLVKKLKIDGFIFLYLPHPECAIWHPGSPFVGNGHKWMPKPEIINSALRTFGCEVIIQDDGPDAMYSFYVCGRKTNL